MIDIDEMDIRGSIVNNDIETKQSNFEISSDQYR